MKKFLFVTIILACIIFAGMLFLKKKYPKEMEDFNWKQFFLMEDEKASNSNQIVEGPVMQNAGADVDANKKKDDMVENKKEIFNCGEQSVFYGGKNYATVKIGDQCWFKENLNVGTMLSGGNSVPDNPSPEPGNPATIFKWCYENKEENCDSFGGLYTWAEANALDNSCNTSFCSLAVKNQGICPPNWHIPTDADFRNLEIGLGMTREQADIVGWRGTDQGSKMSKFVLNGDDASGFSGLLAGYHDASGVFKDQGSIAYFWSSSGYSALDGWRRGLQNGFATIVRFNSPKIAGFSVRCVND